MEGVDSLLDFLSANCPLLEALIVWGEYWIARVNLVFDLITNILELLAGSFFDGDAFGLVTCLRKYILCGQSCYIYMYKNMYT